MIEAAHHGAPQPFLCVRGLTKSYGGVQAVDSMGLDIYLGEVLALVGDNGAGKSTLIKMLAGVIRPDAGRIVLDGEPVRIATPSQACSLGIETLHQHLGLVDVFNVTENVFLGRELRRRYLGVIPGLDHRVMRRRTLELLERLGLRFPSIDRPVRSMSGGQRQSVAISRLLLSHVRLLIMDEPLAALGVDEGRKVLELIANLRDQGYGVVVISHNLEHVFTVADRIAVMKNGSLVGVVETGKIAHDDVVAMIVSGRTPDHVEVIAPV
jgi:ABC-type sugar transport system ATPase subunit